MKKIYFAISMLLLPLASFSQDTGKWSFAPRAGVTVSNITGGKTDGMYSPKVGFTIGGDVEYRFSKLFGLSGGIFYIQQGMKENTAVLVASTTEPTSVEELTELTTDENRILQVAVGKNAAIDFNPANYAFYVYSRHPKVTFHTLSIPILAQLHVWHGLTVKAGIQNDILVSAKARSDVEMKVSGVTTRMKRTVSVKSQCNTYSLSIPIGLSYTYQRMELDVRYLWGITAIAKDQDGVDSNTKYDVRTSTVMMTLGYKL